MPSAGDTIIGLALALLAGLCNSLWNVPFSPKLNVAVGRNAADGRDLDHHYAWTLFLVYGASINIPLCLYWAGGPDRVNYIIENSETLDIALVIIFSLLFGCGTLGFGIACKIAGVGLGTNLTIGLIMILGTFLPLVLDDILKTATGGVILAGLGVCSVGLYFSMKSLQLRDQDQTVASKHQEQDSSNMENTNEGESSASSLEDGTDKAQAEAEEGPSTIVKIVVCTLAAIVATCLQFAFVFGQPIIDIAVEDGGPGSTPDSGAAAIIWLFVIPLCTVPSILYGLLKSEVSFQVVWRCPWWRHLFIVSTASVPWLGHIHLYGIANTFLPDHLSASVAWPVLLSSTVVLGMIWSVLLGEWKGASVQATKNLKIGFAFLFAGVVVVMSSAALED